LDFAFLSALSIIFAVKYDRKNFSPSQCFGSRTGSALDPHSMAAWIRIQEAIKELK
jgi:hypothetical protein